MGTIAIKDEVIRVRVSKEQKELFKSIAKSKKVSMSEFMVVSTEERALREKEKAFTKELLEKRVYEVEKKIQKIKCKMDNKSIKKKSFFGKFLKKEI